MSQSIDDLFGFVPQQKKKKKRKNSRSKQKKTCSEMADENEGIQTEQISSIQSIPVSIIQCLNQKQWEGALHYLEPLLDTENDGIENVRLLVFLLWRSECFFEINDYESCAEDCRRIIHLLPDQDPRNNFWFKSRWRLILSLIQLEAFEEAKSIVQQLSNVCEEFIKHECVKLLERIEERNSLLDNETITLTSDDASNQIDNEKLLCVFCNLNFENESDLGNHYSTKSHLKSVISNKGSDWKKRPPPQKSNSSDDTSYSLCPAFVISETGTCDNGSLCENAHGIEEFNEWRERSEYLKMKQLAEKASRCGKSYTELFLKRSVETSNQEKTMRYSLEGVDVEVDGELTSVVHTEICDKKWIFKLNTTRVLKAVILVDDSYRYNFLLNRITATLTNSKQVLIDEEPTNAQEWISQQDDENEDQLTYKIEVIFFTKNYGTYCQTVLFDFGPESVLAKKLNVGVIDENPGRIKEMLKELGLSSTERWTSTNALIIPFTTAGENITKEEEISTKYCVPTEQNFHIAKSINEDNITPINYRSRMHQLSFIEEMACYEQIAKYNIQTPINFVNSLPSISGAKEKVSVNGELFAIMCFDDNISEDSPAGRLLLNNCTTVLIGDSKKISKKKSQNRNPTVYQALIEDIGRNIVYLRLSARAVTNLKLKPQAEGVCNRKLEVQFQLNRYAFCKWHQAIDGISDLAIIFPNLSQVINLPDIYEMKWTGDDSKLNNKQKEAVAAITLPRDTPLPPVLVLGPFGTGKTYALVQAVKRILLEEDSKILICTHSNSAADVYVEEYLHPLVNSGVKEAAPLRIYHPEHRVMIGKAVLKYCSIEIQNNARIFKVPTLENVLNHRIIVTTMDVASHLSDIDLPADYFTHIMIDEAAQALECESLIPLALANERTRIVLAGDPMQLGSEIFSSFAKQKKFQVSLLQRLFESYPPTFPKFIFGTNYRTHKVIVDFNSNIFYNNVLINTVEQPPHDKFYPLNFFSIGGQDIQEHSGFRNSNEVQELIKRVIELKNNWPASWGKFNENSIAVLTPYQDQTDYIRLELMKYKTLNIAVENISDVQGKQFRVVFLSTVRTGFTCAVEPKSKNPLVKDFGFLSDAKFINTALSRAQSLIAVVGDPVSLCIFGQHRDIWMKFIDACSRSNSLHGLTLPELKFHVFETEKRRIATINPSQPHHPQATTTAPPGFSYPSLKAGYPLFPQMPLASGHYMQINFHGGNVYAYSNTAHQLPHQASNTTTNYLSSMNMKPTAWQNTPQAGLTRSTMVYMPPYPYSSKGPYFGFGVFPPATQYTQSQFVASPGLASFNSGANSTSIPLSQYTPSKSPSVSSIATEASSQSIENNFSSNPVYDRGDFVPADQNRVCENDSKSGINYSNLRTIETDNSMPQFTDKTEPEEQEECNELLAKAIISSGSPLNLVENEYFKDFLKKLRPSYEILDEKSLRKTHLDQEFDKMTARVNEILANVPNIGLRIDSWSYQRYESVINIMLSVPEPILYKCIRTTEDQQTEEYIIEIISKVIEELGSERVFAVICHNTATVEKSKEILSKQFPHITATHCLVESLNSIVDFLLEECVTVKTIRQQCFNLVNAIEKSRILSASFAKIKKEDPTRYEPGLILPISRQWDTLLKCFESIMLNKSVLQKLVQGESVQTLIEDVNSTLRDGELWSLFNNIVSFKSTLLNDIFWIRLNVTFTLLKPIIKWILILEEDKCRISDVVDAFKDIKNGFEVLERSISTCIPVQEKFDMIEYLDRRRKEALKEIHFAAYFLNPANTVQYEKLDMIMSSEEISSAFRFIHNMTLHPYLSVSTQKIMNEIAQYRTKKGHWKDDFLWENVESRDFDPVSWWEAYCSRTELSKIAIPILEMPVVSASPERSFSEISIKRDLLPGEDAVKITYIAHNMDLMKRTKSKFDETRQSEPVENSEDDEFIDAEFDH